MNFRRKEKGVILLSCLVFLLILLTMLRFIMGSARLEELKVGADYDEIRAHEAAVIVMKDAENDILRRVGGQVEVSSNIRDYWAESENWVGRAGVYDGDTAPCTDQLCTNHVGSWANTSDCGSSNKVSQTVCYGGETKLTDDNMQLPEKGRGKYIVEVFQGNGPKLNLGQDEAGTILLRVTAVGYSTPSLNGDNATRVMLQNTYIFGGLEGA